MITLTGFLTFLPGLRPRKAREKILLGNVLSAEERSDIHNRSHSILDTVVLVGPDAAAAILKLYKLGQLPMQRASLLGSPTPAADAYLDDAATLRVEVGERRRRQRAVSDPSLLKETDLDDFRLLNDIFFAQSGKGSGMLVLAGIPVSKSVAGYPSNSGKTVGWRVTFSWVGSDGQRRGVESVPPQAENRRNDADRNWGLHE